MPGISNIPILIGASLAYRSAAHWIPANCTRTSHQHETASDAVSYIEHPDHPYKNKVTVCVCSGAQILAHVSARE